MKNEKIKIMIVDDHEFFRKGIVNLMKRFKKIEIVGEFNSGEEYLQKINSDLPNVVLMDVKMNKINGIVTTQISTRTRPEIKIIALTFEKDQECTNNLIHAGVRGILYKDASIKEIVDAIITVHNGNYYFKKHNSK